jgi:hypothetical protein
VGRQLTKAAIDNVSAALALPGGLAGSIEHELI